MSQQQSDVRSLVYSLTRGRRPYVAAAIAVVVLASVTVAQCAPSDEAPAAEPPIAEEQVPPVTIDSAIVDSAAILDTVNTGRPAIVLEGATTDEMFGFAAIEDGVPRMRRPDVVRGLYLNAYAAGSTRKLDKLIDIANRTEINTFVIDVKEAGEISYRSRIPLARAIGSAGNNIPDPRAVLRKLRDAGIYPIARIVVFKDGKLAQARPDWAVQHADSGDWLDHDGYRWVDSFNRNVWDYNIAIAREALELGFAEVQWDYVRFPDVPQRLMRLAVWPAREGRTKADGIHDFLAYAREQLAPYDAPLTADVFGLVTSVRGDMGIGQVWEKMANVADALLPMVYPSHYVRGSYGIAHPNASPYETVKTALEFAVRRNTAMGSDAKIVAWLQDFTLGKPRYDPAHVRAQIDAVYDAGLSDWVLWHPGSNYTVEALATADGVVPILPRPTGVYLTQDTATAAPTDTSQAPLGKPINH